MESFPMTIPSEIQATILAMAAKGDSTEAMIARMREMGLSKPHSIKLLRDAKIMSLREAKEQVHFSPVWSDRLASDEAFHDAVYQDLVSSGLEEETESKLHAHVA
jgi:ribosomal protein L7/L12